MSPSRETAEGGFIPKMNLRPFLVDNQLELPAQHPALFVHMLDAELIAAELGLGDHRMHAGLGERRADPDRRLRLGGERRGEDGEGCDERNEARQVHAPRVRWRQPDGKGNRAPGPPGSTAGAPRCSHLYPPRSGSLDARKAAQKNRSNRGRTSSRMYSQARPTWCSTGWAPHGNSLPSVIKP